MRRNKHILKVNLDWTVAELEAYFSQVFPYLSLDIYHNGEEIGRSFHKFPLRKIAFTQQPIGFVIDEKMKVAELVAAFLENLGMQVAVSRKLANSKVETTFTSQWTLEKQNNIGSEVFIDFQK